MNTGLPVQAYRSVSERTQTLPNPQLGQSAFMLDTGAFVVYHGPTVGWAPPWGTTWGLVRSAEITSSPLGISSLNGDDLTDAGLAITFTPVAARRYLVAFDGHLLGDTNLYVEAQIRNSYGTDRSDTWARGGNTSQKPRSSGAPTALHVQRVYGEGAPPVVGGRPVTFYIAQAGLDEVSIEATGIGLYADTQRPCRISATDIGPAGPAPTGN